ncbi:MAG: response regulator [Candidatus Thorarchaeota archaeon]
MINEKVSSISKKILLVEDNERDTELTLLILSELNLIENAIIVNDGVEALEFLQGKGKYSNVSRDFPYLILLDLKMPKIDGFEVLKEIKQDHFLKNIPVVIFTSSTQESDIKKAYELGANAYVVKSIDFEEFSKAIKEICSFWLKINSSSIGLSK